MEQKKHNEITVTEAIALLKPFRAVFDIARFVDPAERKILILSEDGTVQSEPYTCYKVWNKVDRCENCISLKSQHSGCRNSKYEFVNDDVFQVIANPFVIRTSDGKRTTVVLELVNNTTDEIVFEAFGKAELIDKINRTNRKIYEDSLTQVHNRRYFDERVFCFAGRANLTNQVVFVMADLKKFKHINDDYGHETGDVVLTAAGAALKSCVRSSDAVIRMGGDEFLIVLKDCPEQSAESIIDKMRTAINGIVYDPKQNLHAVANFGWSFTAEFAATDSCIDQLIRLADQKMYEDKNRA